MKKSVWNGFSKIDFEFEEKEAIIVIPNKTSNGKWLLKTEYFDAFPNLEIEMLKKFGCFNRNE